jgi:hypothetical protein
MFGTLLATLVRYKQGNLSGLGCVIDDNFSLPANDDSSIAIVEEDFKEAPSEDEAFAGSKRQKSVDEAAELAAAQALQALAQYLVPSEQTTAQGMDE